MHTITHFGDLSSFKINLKSDEEILNDLAIISGYIHSHYSNRINIETNLSDLDAWVSANSICNFLSFLEHVLSNHSNVIIKISLFDEVVVNEMRSPENYVVDTKKIKKFTDRLRFYHRWDVAQQIFRICEHYEAELKAANKVLCYPSEITFNKLIKQFHELVYFNPGKYSSTLMPLSSLDTDEFRGPNKIRADKRIKNLILILWTHFHGHEVQTLLNDETSNEDLRKLNQLRHISGVIMYELIKNIYQHARTQSSTSTLGFTTVQINKRSTLNSNSNTLYPKLSPSRAHKKVNLYPLLSPDEHNPQEVSGDAVRFLTISICDFGVGIPGKIREVLSMEQNSNAMDDLELIRRAIFTPFTTKQSAEGFNEPEFYYTRDERIPLSKRGFGWITAALFIGSQLGTFNITSGRVSTTYRTTTEGHGAILELLQQHSTIEAAEELFREPMNVFDEATRELLEIHQVPGTRIMIEIPIIYRWLKPKPEFRTLKEEALKKLSSAVRMVLA